MIPMIIGTYTSNDQTLQFRTTTRDGYKKMYLNFLFVKLVHY